MQGDGRRGEGRAWRLAAWAGAWIAGTALQLQQHALWPGGGYAALAVGGAALAAVAAAARGAWRAPALVQALVVALGLACIAYAVTGWRAAVRLSDALPPGLEERDLVLTGVVATLPRHGLNGVRFAFDVETATLDGSPVRVPSRVSLGWFRGVDAAAPGAPPLPVLLQAPRTDPRAGQRWRLPVRLRQPHGAMNPHGFDLELWMWERGLRASGYVRARKADDAVPLGDAAGYPVARLRQALRDRIAAQVDDARAAGVVAALAIGDQGAIDRADWDLFRATGVVHLMVISGLHVTLFAWLAARAVGVAWRRSVPLMRAVPAPQAARWGGLALAAGYAVLAGWGVPAQRTVAMLAVVTLLQSLALRWPAPWVLGAAALAVTLGDPWALRQPGFWLSFVAVALLMVSAPAASGGPPPGAVLWRRVLRAAAGGVRTQAVATLGLAPLTLLFFQQVSVVGFVANLVAIPAVTLVVTPLALAGALWAPLWSAAAAALKALVAVLTPLAAWPPAVWMAAAAPGWLAAAGMVGGTVAVLPLPWRLRALGAALLLPLLAPAPALPPHGRFELVALDVGQGTAVLVRTRRHLLVYDAGPAWGADSDAGQRLLVPLLHARGERRVDRLVLSHRDTDHVGGAAALLCALPVGHMLSSLAPDHPLRAPRRGPPPAPHDACAAGQHWIWDGVRFDVLHPPPDGLPAARPNAGSCVLRVADARGASVLLTGDIEAPQEVALALHAGAALASTVLMVPHHGSRTSSSPPFLDAVQPATAFVQAAYRSRFGHPAPDVLARYAERGVRVVRSDRCGAWTWRGDGPGTCEREERRRYWHHRP